MVSGRKEESQGVTERKRKTRERGIIDDDDDYDEDDDDNDNEESWWSRVSAGWETPGGTKTGGGPAKYKLKSLSDGPHEKFTTYEAVWESGSTSKSFHSYIRFFNIKKNNSFKRAGN